MPSNAPGLLLAAVLLSGCATSMEWRYGLFPPDAAELEAQRRRADSLWNLRGDPADARKALEAFERAARMSRTEADLWAMTSRAYYLTANYLETQADKKYWLFQKGVAAAEKALLLHPDYRRVYRLTGSEIEAVGQIGPPHLAAAYWYAANLGKRLAEESELIRVGNAELLSAFCSRVMQLDPEYFFGGPHRYLAAVLTKLPGGDLREAKEHFENSLRIAPDYFGTRVLYAEYYAVTTGDRRLFERQLRHVLDSPPDALPEAEPENRYEQARARFLLDRAPSLFPRP